MGLVVGITGSFKCGKTTCAKMFKSLGASNIDADKIYHRLLETSSPMRRKIIAAFGKPVLGRDQKINRKKLARAVFADKRALNKLTEITHPAIIKELKLRLTELKKNKKDKAITIDAPLLIEAGLTGLVDKLIVVKADRNRQVKRARKELKIAQPEIASRISAQLPQKAKIKLADYVIDNNGSLKQTREQVKNIWQAIGRRRTKCR